MHPAEKDPLWNFTVPEALALVEHVSRELRPLVVDNIPLGDRLTVAQVMRIYRWRSVIDVAEKAYDVWRVVRLVNPVAAVTNEARERLTKKLYSSVRSELETRLTHGYITEVGRAAIELYSGRLRLSSGERTGAGDDAATVVERSAPDSSEPVRLLAAGRAGVARTALVDAMSQAQAASGNVVVEVVEPDGTPRSLRRLSRVADTSDLIVWVASRTSVEREHDLVALESLRETFATRTDRHNPPIVVVVAPAAAGEPSGGSGDSAKILVATELGVDADSVVVVGEDADTAAVGFAELREKIATLLPRVRLTQAHRRMRRASKWKIRKVWSQAVNAGRVAARALRKS